MKKIVILSLFTALLSLNIVWAQLSVSLPDTVITCNSPYNLSAIVTGGTSPYSYYWNTGATTAAINVTQSGIFTITVTDAIGASASASSTVFMSSLQVTSSTNCLQPGDSVTLIASVSSSLPMLPYTFSWNMGQATSTIVVNAAGNYDCTVTDGMGCISNAQYTLIDCPPLTSSITGKAYFDNNTNGIFDGSDALIPYHPLTLTPGNVVVFTDASGQYQLNVDTLINFTVTVSPIGNIVAATPTYTVNFPNSGLVSSGNDFAFPPNNDLACYLVPGSTSSPGFPLYYYLMYENYGQNTANGTSLTMTYDANLQFNYSTVPPTSAVGNTLTWNTGNLPPNTNGSMFLSFTTPIGTALGTTLTNSVQISPTDANPSNNTASDIQVVSGSWDPNDKHVSMPEMLHSVAITGKELDYTVQFQNTGTAAAQKVVVIDTLDTKVNVTTFQMLTASHPFTLELIESHILKWTFNNIQLPDSFTDEPGSHGYIHYRIAPQNTVNIGDIIHNTAAIYFDFNSPIFTQDATTTITSPNAIEEQTAFGNLSIIPNPVQDKFMLSFSSQTDKATQINLYNSNGTLIYNEKVATNKDSFQKEISLKAFSTGFYYLQVLTEKGHISQKLIKM